MKTVLKIKKTIQPVSRPSINEWYQYINKEVAKRINVKKP